MDPYGVWLQPAFLLPEGDDVVLAGDVAGVLDEVVPPLEPVLPPDDVVPPDGAGAAAGLFGLFDAFGLLPALALAFDPVAALPPLDADFGVGSAEGDGAGAGCAEAPPPGPLAFSAPEPLALSAAAYPGAAIPTTKEIAKAPPARNRETVDGTSHPLGHHFP